MINELNQLSNNSIDVEVLKTIEELTELNEVLIKFINKGVLKEFDLVDEISDSEIMIERLKYKFAINDKVEDRKIFKVERQIQRIKDE